MSESAPTPQDSSGDSWLGGGQQLKYIFTKAEPVQEGAHPPLMLLPPLLGLYQEPSDSAREPSSRPCTGSCCPRLCSGPGPMASGAQAAPGVLGARGRRPGAALSLLGPGGSVLGAPASSWEQPSCPPKPCAQATLGAPAVSSSMALTKALSHMLLAQASAGLSVGHHPQRGLAQGYIQPSAG